MAKKKSSRTIVGEPLTPSLLKELGAVKWRPYPSKVPPRDGSWLETWRIWTCHGYRESGNQDVGYLRIERIGAKADDEFALKVRQEVIQNDGILNTIDAEIKCLANQLASPVEWRLSSSFIDADEQTLAKLGTREEARIEGNVMTVRTGNRIFERSVPPRLTADWCFFEAVQRLKFEDASSFAFDMLEGLSLLKPQQRLRFSGSRPAQSNIDAIPRHCFRQIGTGILPCEYWLDDTHRLLAVTTMNKAYILDNTAQALTERKIKESRKSQDNSRK